jgi:hypothetical protein
MKDEVPWPTAQEVFVECPGLLKLRDEDYFKYIRALQKERIKLYKRWKHEHAQGARRFGSE